MYHDLDSYTGICVSVTYMYVTNTQSSNPMNNVIHLMSDLEGKQLVLFSRESWCLSRRSRGKHQDSRLVVRLAFYQMPHNTQLSDDTKYSLTLFSCILGCWNSCQAEPVPRWNGAMCGKPGIFKSSRAKAADHRTRRAERVTWFTGVFFLSDSQIWRKGNIYFYVCYSQSKEKKLKIQGWENFNLSFLQMLGNKNEHNKEWGVLGSPYYASYRCRNWTPLDRQQKWSKHLQTP